VICGIAIAVISSLRGTRCNSNGEVKLITVLIRILMVLLIGRQAYEEAKAKGIWSWKSFALVMIGMAVILLISIPILLKAGDALRLGNKLWGIIGFACYAFIVIGGVIFLALWTKPRKHP
jgi:hypothetical protein